MLEIQAHDEQNDLAKAEPGKNNCVYISVPLTSWRTLGPSWAKLYQD